MQAGMRVMTNLLIFLIAQETDFNLKVVTWEAGNTLPLDASEPGEVVKVIFLTSATPTQEFLELMVTTIASCPSGNVGMYLDREAAAARQIALTLPRQQVWQLGNYGDIANWVYNVQE